MLWLLWSVFAPVPYNWRLQKKTAANPLLWMTCISKLKSSFIRTKTTITTTTAVNETNGGWCCTMGRNGKHTHPYHPWDFCSWLQAIQCDWPNAKNDPAPWSSHKCSFTAEKWQTFEQDGTAFLLDAVCCPKVRLHTSTFLQLCKFRFYWNWFLIKEICRDLKEDVDN